MVEDANQEAIKGVVQRINALESDVSGMGAKVDNLIASVDRLANKSDQPTNWVGIGGLVFGAFTVAMAVMALSTSPLSERLYNVELGLRDRTELVYSAPRQLENLEHYAREHQQEAIRLAEKAATHDANIEWHRQWLTFLENQTDQHKSELNELRDRVARNEGEDAEMHELISRLEEFSRESAYIHGQREALEKRVNDIDNLGSRRWNGREDQP